MGRKRGKRDRQVRHGGNDQLQNRDRVFVFNLPSELIGYLRRANAIALLPLPSTRSGRKRIGDLSPKFNNNSRLQNLPHTSPNMTSPMNSPLSLPPADETGRLSARVRCCPNGDGNFGIEINYKRALSV